MDLRKLLRLETNDLSPESAQLVAMATSVQASPGLRRCRLTPDGKQGMHTITGSRSDSSSVNNLPKAESNQNEDEENFFDLLSRFQSKRMDDQRCSLFVQNSLNSAEGGDHGCVSSRNGAVTNGDTQDDLWDLIMGIQSKRMDEQRVELPNLPGLCRSSISSDSGLLENLKVKPTPVQLDDKREAFVNDVDDEKRGHPANKKSTVPDEDFFSLILRLQSSRMDDQRAKLKK